MKRIITFWIAIILCSTAVFSQQVNDEHQEMVSEEGKAAFDFYTSDFTTSYSVVIEGLSENGDIIRKVEQISVQ